MAVTIISDLTKYNNLFTELKNNENGFAFGDSDSSMSMSFVKIEDQIIEDIFDILNQKRYDTEIIIGNTNVADDFIQLYKKDKGYNQIPKEYNSDGTVKLYWNEIDLRKQLIAEAEDIDSKEIDFIKNLRELYNKYVSYLQTRKDILEKIIENYAGSIFICTEIYGKEIKKCDFITRESSNTGTSVNGFENLKIQKYIKSDVKLDIPKVYLIFVDKNGYGIPLNIFTDKFDKLNKEIENIKDIIGNTASRSKSRGYYELDIDPNKLEEYIISAINNTAYFSSYVNDAIREKLDEEVIDKINNADAKITETTSKVDSIIDTGILESYDNIKTSVDNYNEIKQQLFDNFAAYEEDDTEHQNPKIDIVNSYIFARKLNSAISTNSNVNYLNIQLDNHTTNHAKNIGKDLRNNVMQYAQSTTNPLDADLIIAVNKILTRLYNNNWTNETLQNPETNINTVIEVAGIQYGNNIMNNLKAEITQLKAEITQLKQKLSLSGTQGER